MKIFLVVVGLLYGVYWYASSRYNFSDTFTYAKTHEYEKNSQAAMYYIGLVYHQRSDYEKSKEVFNQLALDYSTGPYVASALYRLSDAATETRDYPLARQALERFIAEYPTDKRIRMMEQRYEVIKFK